MITQLNQSHLKNINNTISNKTPVVYGLYKPQTALCADIATCPNVSRFLYIGVAKKGDLKNQLLQLLCLNENILIFLKIQEHASLKSAEQETTRLISIYRPHYNRYYQPCLF